MSVAAASSSEAVLDHPGSTGAAAALAGFAFVVRKYLGGTTQEIVVHGEQTSLAFDGADTLASLLTWAQTYGDEVRASAPLPNVSHGSIRLTVAARAAGNRVQVCVHGSDEVRADRLLGHVLRAGRAALLRPDLRLRDVDVLDGQERTMILSRFNDTARVYPREATLPTLFAEQARRRPDALAVVAPDRSLTYGQLDRDAQRVAGRLVRAGVSPGDPVAVLAGKTSGPIVAILGILMAGATYVPIDPSYPLARRDLLMRDCGSRVLVTAGDPGAVAAEGLTLIDVSEEPDVPASVVDSAATDAAYIMYTSGTTGVPKGALISHRSVVRLVCGVDYATFSPLVRMLQTCSPGFDVATFEIWGTLLNGGTLFTVPGHVVLDPIALGAVIRHRKITNLFLTTALFHQLAEQDATIFRPLSELVVGGDVLFARHAGLVLAACPGLRLVNGYGPTENTTFSTAFLVERPLQGRVPIGSPIPNSTAYVVDRDGWLQPVGIPGELLVGGDGVSLGYLNRPEQNERAFVADSFGGTGRLYRTGDRARWLQDGNLDYLGRLDDQVKIRGFRIEPTEVEKHIGELPGVGSVAVQIRTAADGTKSLRAYFTADRPIGNRQLRAALRIILPEYMIPAAFVQVTAMPFTTHGKIDRRALDD